MTREFICLYKRIVEEILFPTGSNCEICDGYETWCRDYKPEGFHPNFADDSPLTVFDEAGK